MPSGPDEVGEKQDNHQGAPSLELLKETGQYVAEYENLKTGQHGGSDEPQYCTVPEGTRRARAQQGGDEDGYPGKNQKDQRFDSQAPAAGLSSRFGFFVFGHVLAIS
jgi:hypothetical protein